MVLRPDVRTGGKKDKREHADPDVVRAHEGVVTRRSTKVQMEDSL
jgi:hypothetical protein